MRKAERFSLILSIVVLAGILAAAVFWALDHPFPINWDEAQYFNQDQSDIRALKTEGLHGLARNFFHYDPLRPPAYRVLAIPFTYLLGFNPAVARFVSLACFVATLFLTFLGVWRMAGRVAAAFAVIFLSLCPGIIFPSMMFGTECSLYLSTAGVLYFLFTSWNGGQENPRNWIGLGLSLGLGALSKTSFPLIGGPILLVALFASRRKSVVGIDPKFLLKSAVLGGFIAMPWWLMNGRSALLLANYARTFTRDSLGAPSMVTWTRWLLSFAEGSIGLPLAVLSVLICLLFIRHSRATDKTRTRSQSTAALFCFIAGVPLILSGMFSTTHNLRYVTPSLILFAPALGILLKSLAGWRWWLASSGSVVLFLFQWAMILVPAIHPVPYSEEPGIIGGRTPGMVMSRWEQWDWNRLREIARSHGMTRPSVSFLGSCSTMDVEQIAYPWFAHNEKEPKVRWLWRYEKGPIEWNSVMRLTNASDIVLTAPDYAGAKDAGEDLDNQHNKEFVRRLGGDSTFQGPIHMRLGRFTPVDVVVFVRSHQKAAVAESRRKSAINLLNRDID